MAKIKRFNKPKPKLTSQKVGLSRKVRRKLERKEKKARKGEFFAKKYGKLNSKDDEVSKVEIEFDDDFKNELVKNTTEKPPMKKKKKTDSAARIRKKQLQQANKDEEKNIKSLAKKLKLNKRKNKKLPKSFDEDGLGYILEVLDNPEGEGPAFNLEDVDLDINDDLTQVLGVKNLNDKKRKLEEEEEEEEEEESNSDQSDCSDEDEIDENIEDKSTEEASEISDDEENSDQSDDNEENSDQSVDDFFLSEPPPTTTQSKLVKENPQNVKPTLKTNVDASDHNPKKQVSWSDLEKNEALPVISDAKKTKKKENKAKKKKISIEFEYEADEIETMEEVSEENDEKQEDEDEEYWEDIYGRTRDKEGNVVVEKIKIKPEDSNKYIPPAKRAQALLAPLDSKKKAELNLLKKQLKGLFNRLSESNMKFMSDQIEDMYMKHSRNDMNQTITNVILESVVSPAVAPERLVMEHALLVALLHANVGTEVGAHILQSLATNLDERVRQGGNYGEGKEVDNLLLLICHLYTFKITHNSLIYDIVKFLADTFTEKDVELILLVLRSIGFGLRKDNPISLKEMIISLQNKATSVGPNFLDQSRVRFMIEALMAIRNNNVNKLPNYDPSLSEHLRKLLRSLLRRGSYVQELHISFADLLKANERGRWWIVGSAWQGLKENEDQSKMTTGEEGSTSILPLTAGFSDKILELARKQRMNTETRKNIFCIVMSAEDFMDAFEKLLHLGLKNQQEREIIHVILACLMQEQTFNPYYAYLAEKFCQFDRRFQMTLQFALWDKFKELSKLDKHQISNMAQFLVILFVKGALPISVLKVIQLAEMEKSLVKFLRQIMLALLLHEKEEVAANVFARIAGAPKLHMLREGLRLFMHHFLLRNIDKMDPEIAQKLRTRVQMIENVFIEKRK